MSVSLNQTDTDTSMPLLHITLFGLNIRNRRKTSVILGWKIPFIEIQLINRIRIECREKSAHMAYLINRHTVNQEQILIIISSPDIHSAHSLHAHSHTWQLLDAFD